MADEIFTNIPKSEALQQAEITAIRQMGDAIGAMGRSLEKVVAKVDDVRERVIALEAEKISKVVEALNMELRHALTRIDILESQRDQAKGAASVWGWFSKNAPWVLGWLGAITAFILGFGVKDKLP